MHARKGLEPPCGCYNRRVATESVTAAIGQRQNARLWLRMSWVRSPLAAPNSSPPHLSDHVRTPAHRLRRHVGLGLCQLEARLLSGEDTGSAHAGILRVAAELCGGELHLPAVAHRKAIDDLVRGYG